MSTKKIAVIFDTNAYRNLVNAKSEEDALKQLEEIITLEREKDIQAFGSIIVGMEMLANLAEGEGGFNYRDCLLGTRFLAKHCYDSEGGAPRLISHVPLLLEHTFFGEIKSKDVELDVRNMGGTIVDFDQDLSKAVEHHNRVGTFENIKRYLDKKEEEFADQIQDLIDGAKTVVLQRNPGIDKKVLRTRVLSLIKSEAFLEMMSMALVKVIFDNVNMELTTDGLHSRGKFLRKHFPLAAGFYQWICFEVFDKNIDLQSKGSKKKRWNWIWDYNVSYAVSNSSLDGREVILITADSDLSNILTDHGYGVRVMTLEDYLIFLRVN